jgi:hypothetical protein
MDHRLEITIAHVLPNRVRLRLSRPLKDAGKTVRNIKRHDGIASIGYTPETHNLLVGFDHRQVSLEEIIIRTALAFSAEHNLAATTIKASQPTTALGELSFLSGLAVISGHLLRFLSPRSNTFQTMQYVAGLGTSLAVFDHTYSDLKQTGRFHPEVLSVVYLLASFIRGNPLKGATIAWVTTFARHLLEPPVKDLKIEAEAIDPACDADQCEFEAQISNRQPHETPRQLLTRLPGFLIGLYRESNATIEDRIFREIWKLSDDHQNVLEGIENISRGIRLNIVR